jgi:WD40 repeat protein
MIRAASWNRLFGVGLVAAALVASVPSLQADLFVASIQTGMNTILQYDETTGNFIADFGAEIPGNPISLLWQNGVLYVASDAQKAILNFDSSGNFLGVFVQSMGELNGLRGMIFDTNGNLYVCSKFTNTVEQYDSNGNHLGSFIAAGTSPLSGPRGLVWGPDGNLYVASFNTGQVLSYDPNGNYLGIFTQNDNGALTNGVNGLVFGPDGNLYVTAANSGGIMQYDPTGNFLQAFVQKGNSPLNDPLGILFDGNGNLYVTDDVAGGVLQYDPSGNYLGYFVDPVLSTPPIGKTEYLTFTKTDPTTLNYKP